MFQREDWTVFRSLETLPQKAGVPLRKLPDLVAKELTDNALDAAGDCRIVLAEGNGFFVEDDGDGIPGDDTAIASLFSIRRPLTSSKILRMPTRGALGNGLRVVAGVVLASRGELIVSTRGRTLRLIPKDDGSTEAVSWGACDRPGTRVDVSFGPPLIVDDATLNHAREAILLAGGKRYEGKTSAHWYDSDAFYELLQASDGRTVRELVAEFDGCAEPKAGKIALSFKGRASTSLSRTEANQLLAVAREKARIVDAGRLGGIGRRAGLPACHERREMTLTLAATRGGVGATLPAVVECWAEIADEAEVRVTINRTPIMVPIAAWHEKNVMGYHGCNMYGKFPVGRRPAMVHVNIDTPFMPITSDGKTPNLGFLADTLQTMAGKRVRAAKQYLPLLRDNAQPRTQKDIIIDSLPAAIAKAGGNGAYRFSLRQLFYAVRPVMLAEIGKAPEYGYFCDVITGYETEHGDIPGMYRDPRGTLYHPHTGQEIPLGTLNVEGYQRPAWTFNKILYVEKEGFFPLLKEVGWPERNDCALMSAKGFASRAARDVIDLLGRDVEELTFYCVHDADAEGTMIYQGLQEATKARPGRKVRIVNLGLEPAEARALGLQVEPVERKQGKTAPVAAYVPTADRAWLQTNRVELNVMTTPEFLAWLDGKFADRPGKLVPPAEVMVVRLDGQVRDSLRRTIRRGILRRAKLGRRVEDAYQRRRPLIADAAATIAADVRDELADDIAGPRRNPVPRG